MRYLIKENVWSMSGKATIMDEAERLQFTLEGKVFSWGHKLTMRDAAGNEVAYIEQKVGKWRPTFNIYRNGEMFAELSKDKGWFNRNYTLDVPGPNDYTIKAHNWRFKYDFYRRGMLVASVNRPMWYWNKPYGVDIKDDEDAVSILSAIIALDKIREDANSVGATTGT